MAAAAVEVEDHPHVPARLQKAEATKPAERANVSAAAGASLPPTDLGDVEDPDLPLVVVAEEVGVVDAEEEVEEAVVALKRRNQNLPQPRNWTRKWIHIG